MKPGDPLKGMTFVTRRRIVTGQLAELSTAEMALYLYLHTILNDKDADSKRSIKRIGKTLGWTERQVSRVISRLVERELVARYQTGRSGVTALLMPTRMPDQEDTPDQGDRDDQEDRGDRGDRVTRVVRTPDRVGRNTCPPGPVDVETDEEMDEAPKPPPRRRSPFRDAGGISKSKVRSPKPKPKPVLQQKAEAEPAPATIDLAPRKPQRNRSGNRAIVRSDGEVDSFPRLTKAQHDSLSHTGPDQLVFRVPGVDHRDDESLAWAYRALEHWGWRYDDSGVLVEWPESYDRQAELEVNMARIYGRR